MNSILEALLRHLVPAMGHALLSFVWQGALIWFFSAVLLRLLRSSTAQTRYSVGCVALVLCVVLPVQTLVAYSIDSNGNQMLREVSTGLGGGNLPETGLSIMLAWLQNQVLILVVLWALCVTFLSVRFAFGLIWVAKIRKPQEQTSDQHWQNKLDQLTRAIGIKQPIALRITNGLHSPTVAGWLRPVVLIPASLITGIAPDLLEALLAHEVAHIHRMDYAVNLLQNIVEILLFYHPAVWWLSNQVRIEREHIADDLAAQLIGEPRRLAVALHELNQFQYAAHQVSMNRLTIGANGGNLVHRIKRLVCPDVQAAGWLSLIPATCLVIVSVIIYANATASTWADAGEKSGPATTKPRFELSGCKPEYPKQSLSGNEQGISRLEFSIDAQGQVSKSSIVQSSGHPMLDEAALTAISKCRFHPATQDGMPVKSSVRIDYVWTLN